jgi:ABC-type bacteriocin/lantibiotic exporter with double-glycine peptidase domain
LRGFNLHVPEGKTAALVGGSGCGKSTVVKIIQRFYEMASGTVSFVLIYRNLVLFFKLSVHPSIHPNPT